MSDSRLVLSKCLNILGFPKPDMENFEQRLLLQKRVYLLLAYGVSLGYGFNWYVRGPYSPKLASDGYALDDEIFDEGSRIQFNNEDTIVGTLNNFKAILGGKMTDPQYLEILASLHYIKKVAFGGRDDFKGITNWLKNQKPYLKNIAGIDDIIRSAYNDLQNFVN